MSRDDVRAAGERLLAAARSVRAAFPDVGAMRRVAIGDRPDCSVGEAPEAARCRAALGFLWDELALVRAGKADTRTVLDDEMTHAAGLLAGL
jgi:hypothetical protein